MNEITERITNRPDGDDGSLSFLNIPPDASRQYFNVKETTQGELVNTSFWIIGFFKDVPTKNGPKYLVKIKTNIDDAEINARKFFTGSQDIKYILNKIEEMNKFPRRVTMRGNGMKYWLE
jgi:hypothetical protein